MRPPKTDQERPPPSPQCSGTFSPPICPAYPDIVLYSLDNGNHMWPGGVAMPGKTVIPVQDISATDLMWNFFKQYNRGAPSP